MFKRALIWGGNNAQQPSRAGDGILGNLRVTQIATDANLTLTTDQMAGGAVQFTSFSAGRNVTTPTGTQIETANPGMDIGDAFVLLVSAVAAFAATYVAGAGVTLAGRATTPASSWSLVEVRKTALNTYTWTVL